MNNTDFKIDIKTVWSLVIGNLLLTIVGALAKVQHWEFSQIFLTVGLILFFSTWIIVFSDMLKNNIYNKSFWIITMFIMPSISTIFYLIQRNKLMRLGQKFSKRLKKKSKNDWTTWAIIHCGIIHKTIIVTIKRPDFISGKVYDVSHNEIIA